MKTYAKMKSNSYYAMMERKDKSKARAKARKQAKQFKKQWR